MRTIFFFLVFPYCSPKPPWDIFRSSRLNVYVLAHVGSVCPLAGCLLLPRSHHWAGKCSPVGPGPQWQGSKLLQVTSGSHWLKVLWMKESPPKASCSSLKPVPEVESSQWLPALVKGEMRWPAPYSVFVQCECATDLTWDEAMRLLLDSKSQPQLHLIFPYAAGTAACADVPTRARAARRLGDGAELWARSTGKPAHHAAPRYKASGPFTESLHAPWFSSCTLGLL